MNNSELGDKSNRPLNEQQRAEKLQAQIAAEDFQPPAINWIKLIALLLFTFGLIVAMWFICFGIQTMKYLNGQRNVFASHTAGGGLLLGFFCFYVLCFGLAWCWGFRQRDRIRREVVQKQLQRQRAKQALIYDE